MRQRNDQDHPLLVHTDPPQWVQPEAEIDHDVPVIGLTVLDDPDPRPDQPADAPVGRKSKAAPTSDPEVATP